MAPSDSIALPRELQEDAVDELYALALDEFTPRRDELAEGATRHRRTRRGCLGEGAL